ncbi:MAG: hypothetical protein ACI85I_000247 [Arenicella sp.]|jgi:hypothetical protein
MKNNTTPDSIQLEEIEIDNESFYRISNVDNMRPFFMSIVSDSNHWMFIGSNGGLSAGRKDSENSLFPYYTDDKIIESSEITGSKSIFIVYKNGKEQIWEPFSLRYESLFKTTRNLYKNVYGNKVIFEEVNHDLELTFRYEWNSSNLYGFVKKSKLTNNGKEEVKINLLDGIQNLIPYGVGSALQNDRSNLVDAYKRSELEGNSGIGIFALSAIIVDKAEPSEALKANIAWSLGLEKPTYLLSSEQLDNFRNGIALTQEEDVKAKKGAYFISKEIILSKNGEKKWTIFANVNQNVASITKLAHSIQKDSNLLESVEKDIELGTKQLIQLNAGADALQLSNDKRRNTRHFANSLFNIMRGGIFDDNYQIEKDDFVKYLFKANKKVAKESESNISKLSEKFGLSTLLKVASDSDDSSFKRLSLEYLPLKFSRRHGDPSRPWNKFSINTYDENDGSKILDYEGNWRDIFQNWEALAHSYPEFIEGMIFRFLNASTFDGYNPYRVTKNGIDWERIEPDDPWSYIGYWGDHQIIYLLKFLEFSEKHYPNKLESYFNEDLFVYADVPYRIKRYYQLLLNPKDTIDFDHEADEASSKRQATLGADGALLTNQNKKIVQVNFVEKILATLLAKMSNFIPEGGIWMNTQRPEWNDANNALVGNGVSMVTLYYMIRFFKFSKNLFGNSKMETVQVSAELKLFYSAVISTLNQHEDLLSGKLNDQDRKLILDGLGMAGSSYRQTIYEKSFHGEKKEIAVSELVHFSELCLSYLQHTLKANKREDNLYHAYNLMTVENDEEVSISYLSEMLEGQVGVLSSGNLSSKEALEVLDAMKASKLFREDQYSYMLYPDKELAGFMSKNNIPEASISQSKLLQKLVGDGNTQIVEKDVNGVYHFNANFKNANDLKDAIEQLGNSKYESLANDDKEQVLKIFEEVFNHKAFTGRSGTFFGYEGLGSIYWHMVSKLLVATQECCLKAINDKEDEKLIGRLLEHYYEIHAGIGAHKSPELYGAFPTDPYSHTPKGKGAQQPGMTGQVKEDILCRFGELGVVVSEGKLSFEPNMLRKEEFLENAKTFNYVNIEGEEKQLHLEKGTLAFTYCQIPIVYILTTENSLQVGLKNGKFLKTEGSVLNNPTTEKVFQRTGEITQINVSINKTMLK